MNPIILSGGVAASASDILQGTRLQTVPARGVLTIELQASANVAANNYVVSCELPDGATPLNVTRVPAGATTGGINSNDKLMASFLVTQGGHTTLSFTLTGTATLSWRVTYTPMSAG